MVAAALSEWLPEVLQAVRPWFSPTHLNKGVRWAEELFGVLEKSQLGIMCLTAENLRSPWIAFEAAACTTKVGGKVFTYLLRLDPSQIDGPLAVFNHTLAQREDTRRLLTSINEQLDAPLSESQLSKAFERCWPEFELRLEEIPADGEAEKIPLRSADELANETLGIVREVAKRLDGVASSFRAPYADSGDLPDLPSTKRARNYAVKIDGAQERDGAASFPPDVHFIGGLIADVLVRMYERDYFDLGKPPGASGVASFEIGGAEYRFLYLRVQEGMYTTFRVHRDGDSSLSWVATTNIDGRG